jgi:AAA+ superfamily predicted ATPase
MTEMGVQLIDQIASGELSHDPEVLQKQLAIAFDVARVWGAVMLLDEADVYVEERRHSDLHRNKVVSVFLCALEYFKGILFLTTNRVRDFDAAIASRMQLALQYKELSRRARRSVWDTFLKKARTSAGPMDIPKSGIDGLSQKVLSGRDVRPFKISVE